MNKPFFTLLASLGLLSSCFKSELPNAECDIETVWVHLDNVKAVFTQPTDTFQTVISTDDSIVFKVRNKYVDLTAIAPQFTLSEGATITPASGTVLDFTNTSHEYIVKSQDGKWTRRYVVSFTPKADAAVTMSFEHFHLNDKGTFFEWSDLDAEGKPLKNWATANEGYHMSKSSAKPEEHPTVPCYGYIGKGAQLTTMGTGAWGAMVGRRLAAGNLFIGKFNPKPALTNTLRCTEFGFPFNYKPLELNGYYKYKSGEVVTDSAGNKIPGEVDAGTVYAVLYRNHDEAGNAIVLYGDNVLTSKYIVAIAQMITTERVDEWKKFAAKFEYKEELDEELLKEDGYSLTIVGSSSVKGDHYYGAEGSCLCVDELNLIVDPEFGR